MISNNASSWAGGMAKLVHHFGPACTISTTTECMSITFCTDIHDTQRAYLNDCGDVPTLMLHKDRIINGIISNYMANMWLHLLCKFGRKLNETVISKMRGMNSNTKH